MPQSRNKRSITIARHRTSISLEDAFWESLGEFAAADGKSVAALVGEIDKGRDEASLTAALRLYVLKRMQKERERA